MKATDILENAAQHMRDRAATYDKPDGERSMAKAVAAFNAITGQDLSTAEGWEFMAVLKQVRAFQNPDKPHRDSLEDFAAYSALLGEEMLSAVNEVALKVGQVWADRDGEEVVISRVSGHANYPFVGSNMATYTNSGRQFADKESNLDLISLVRDTEEPQP